MMFDDDVKRTYAYVPEEIAKAIEDGESVEKVKAKIRETYADRATWFADDLATLEDSAARFKGVGAIHKATLEEALRAQDKAIADLSTKLADGCSKAEAKLRKVEERIASVTSTLEQLNEKGRSLWQADRIIEMVEKVDRMDESTKALLSKIIKLDADK
jgi:uncharacterized coiled-coil protein SlyX